MIGTIHCTDEYVVHANQNSDRVTITDSTIAGGSLNLGSGLSSGPYFAFIVPISLIQFLCHVGLKKHAITLPIVRPRNERPIC